MYSDFFPRTLQTASHHPSSRNVALYKQIKQLFQLWLQVSVIEHCRRLLRTIEQSKMQQFIDLHGCNLQRIQPSRSLRMIKQRPFHPIIEQRFIPEMSKQTWIEQRPEVLNRRKSWMVQQTLFLIKTAALLKTTSTKACPHSASRQSKILHDFKLKNETFSRNYKLMKSKKERKIVILTVCILISTWWLMTMNYFRF